MTLLTIIQDAANLLSIPSPTSVVDSTDVQVLQLLALANEEGRELARKYDWQELTRQQTFLTTATAEQDDAVPDDWQRFVSDTFYDRTTMRQLIGPITPQAWQAIQAQLQLNRVFLAFRRRDNTFLITPTPAAGDTIAFEYITRNWCESAGGMAQAYFQADTDVPLLPSYLFTLGIRWRFRLAKGLDYAENFRTYQEELQAEQAGDIGGGKLDQTGRNIYSVFGVPNIPLGNWPAS